MLLGPVDALDLKGRDDAGMIEFHLKIVEKTATPKNPGECEVIAESGHTLNHPFRFNVNFHAVKVHRSADVADDAAKCVLGSRRKVRNANQSSEI